LDRRGEELRHWTQIIESPDYAVRATSRRTSATGCWARAWGSASSAPRPYRRDGRHVGRRADPAGRNGRPPAGQVEAHQATHERARVLWAKRSRACGAAGRAQCRSVLDMLEDDGASAAGVRSNSALWPVTRRRGQASGVGVLDAMLQIRLFGKLKLAICVRSRAQRVDGLSSLRNLSACGSTLIGA
jgi:hypothetical protein